MKPFGPEDLAIYDAHMAVAVSERRDPAMHLAPLVDLRQELGVEIPVQRLVGMERRGLLFRDEIADGVSGWVPTGRCHELALAYRRNHALPALGEAPSEEGSTDVPER